MQHINSFFETDRVHSSIRRGGLRQLPKRQDLRPSTVFAFGSRPTTKKKIVIRPSLIQKRRSRSNAKLPNLIPIGMCQRSASTVRQGELVHTTAVMATTIRTMPLAASTGKKTLDGSENALNAFTGR